MRRLLGTAVLALALPLLALPSAQAGGGHHPPGLRWQERDTPSTESLRGLDAVNGRVAWVAGDDGGVWRTADGGRHWSDVAPAGSADLAFRDVEALGPRTALVLAIGEGRASRIYRTEDAGRSWRPVFVNREPAAFYDCMDFYPDGKHGLAMSDPVDGRFRVIATRDGGRHWHRQPSEGMPAAVDGEAGFAASGTCLETAGRRDVWIGSGGAASRIFHSTDRGRTWTVTTAPIPATPAGGVFSLAFRSSTRGVAVGGDYQHEDAGQDTSGRTFDGDRWFGGGDLGGYRSGVDWVAHRARMLLAVGPSGSDVSRDGGRTWRPFSATGFHSVVCTPDRTCWASGTEGRVARMVRVG